MSTGCTLRSFDAVHLRAFIRCYRKEMQANAGSQQDEEFSCEAVDQWIKGAAAEYCRGMSAIIAHHLSLLRMEKRKRVHAQ